MKINFVRYEIKRTLGQYESETLACELGPDPEAVKPESADELMAEARRICVQHTSEYLKKVRGAG